MPALALLASLLAVLQPLPAAADGATDQVVALVNAQRQQAGLAPLAANPNLAQSAAGYAGVLAGGGCFAHTCGPVPNFVQRDANAGYTGWTALGENIAGGQGSPSAVMAAWLASPEHRANILGASYTEIGVGEAYGGPFGIYWVEEFGSRGAASAPAAVAPSASCAFVLGFRAIHDMIPGRVGTCLGDETHNPANGDALQRTSGGLLVWRKADNWTAFTDGYQTWVNGPYGLAERLNTQRFSWEANPQGFPVVG